MLPKCKVARLGTQMLIYQKVRPQVLFEYFMSFNFLFLSFTQLLVNSKHPSKVLCNGFLALKNVILCMWCVFMFLRVYKCIQICLYLSETGNYFILFYFNQYVFTYHKQKTVLFYFNHARTARSLSKHRIRTIAV